MKFNSKMLTLATVVVIVTATSCQKEETINLNQTPVSSTYRELNSLDPQYPNGKTTNLVDHFELISLVNTSEEYNKINIQGGTIDNAIVVHYGDPNKFTVVFFDSSNTDSSVCKGWSMLVYENNIFHANSFEIKGSDNYFVSLGEKNLFANPNIPFEGTLKVTDLNGTVLISTEINGLRWISHGGFGSWTSCVEHYGSQWWVIVGGVLCPEAVLLGLAVGCL